MRTLRSPWAIGGKQCLLIEILFVMAAYILLPLAFLIGVHWFWKYDVLLILGFGLMLHILSPIGILVACGYYEKKGIELSSEDLFFKQKSILFVVNVIGVILLVCTAAAVNKGLNA